MNPRQNAGGRLFGRTAAVAEEAEFVGLLGLCFTVGPVLAGGFCCLLPKLPVDEVVLKAVIYIVENCGIIIVVVDSLRLARVHHATRWFICVFILCLMKELGAFYPQKRQTKTRGSVVPDSHLLAFGTSNMIDEHRLLLLDNSEATNEVVLSLIKCVVRSGAENQERLVPCRSLELKIYMLLERLRLAPSFRGDGSPCGSHSHHQVLSPWC